MTAAKKVLPDKKASYAIATALHRAKVLVKRQNLNRLMGGCMLC
ncbi:hypothetical protein [Duganella sp. FT27W]|nr:hypothetical protein [Duganella sp. FT27W]